MELVWHPYKYFEYEYDLAEREVQSLLGPSSVSRAENGLSVEASVDNEELIRRLVYFSSAKINNLEIPTLQRELELSGGKGQRRQETRYSVHGLHEYKGKFNPQVVRAILNIFGASEGDMVLDPFCGSGTTLVECKHVGIDSIGYDVNPLAVYVANAKLEALNLGFDVIAGELLSVLGGIRSNKIPDAMDERSVYLREWFEPRVLADIENLKESIQAHAPRAQTVLLVLASNVLRDFSLQDPNDLRIRRRKDPTPSIRFIDAFSDAAESFLDKLKATQEAFLRPPSNSRATLFDARNDGTLSSLSRGRKFDYVITSPPYATALPYIDTQRLSLVWLDLLSPSQLSVTESELIGSRELRGSARSQLVEAMEQNADEIPQTQIQLCHGLASSLSESDGFRRKAVPILLYRYFRDMQKMFSAIRERVHQNAPFALVVGRNRTTLGGHRFTIDTPQHLAEIAKFNGWEHVESIELQTYQRYGYHHKNAVQSEQLVILRAK